MSEAATPMTLTGTPPPKKDEAKLTEYVILSALTKDNDSDASRSALPGWVEEAKVKSRGANAAIREYLSNADHPDGTYVAVPSRSWQPVTVKTETKTKLAFS